MRRQGKRPLNNAMNRTAHAAHEGRAGYHGTGATRIESRKGDHRWESELEVEFNDYPAFALAVHVNERIDED